MRATMGAIKTHSGVQPTSQQAPNNLATLHQSQDRHAGAVPLYLGTLEKKRKVPGEDHPSSICPNTDDSNSWEGNRLGHGPDRDGLRTHRSGAAIPSRFQTGWVSGSEAALDTYLVSRA